MNASFIQPPIVTPNQAAAIGSMIIPSAVEAAFMDDVAKIARRL